MNTERLEIGASGADMGGNPSMESVLPMSAQSQTRPTILSRVGGLLVLVVLFLAAWLPRTVGLDHFVTIDERKWLARSANFDAAISHADWANTFQREHPGVTVMWAGTLALLRQYPTYPQETPGQFAWDQEYFEEWLSENSTHTPLELLAAGRWVVVILISLVLALGYLPLRRLLGAPIAALATLFIAWDPFAVALSQELHPDGLVAAFTYLALILFLIWLYDGQHWRDLAPAGVVMGLAWLTKTPAIFLVPTGAVLVGVELVRRRGDAVFKWQTLLIGFCLWGAIATATFVALWPAMWVDPLGTLLRMASEMGEYVERHTTINYFWGQPVDDPGPLLYPVAFLFRTTPAVVFGLLAVAVAGWHRGRPLDRPPVRQTAFALLAFALILTVGMSLGAKKFDRYLLPVFPALAILATLGWVAIGDWVIGLLARWRKPSPHPFTPSPPHPFTLALLAAFLLHGLLGFLHYPYYLTYFNPLVGGARSAPRVLFIGWGEGLDETARWLNQQPDVEQLRVTAWYADGPFSYFFSGHILERSYNSPMFWLDNDFVVLYVNQWQRKLPSSEIIDYFLKQTPVYRLQAGGLELARIYDMRTMLPPDFANLGRASAADFGGKIRLTGYSGPPPMVQPGDEVQVTFYLQNLAPMTVNYNILVRLVGQDGNELWRAEGWPWGAPTSDWPPRTIRPDGHTIKIPPAAPPSLYKLTISFYDPATFEPLPVTGVDSEQMLDPATWGVMLMQLGDPPPITDAFDRLGRFGDVAELVGVTMADSAQAGGELSLRFDWQGMTPRPVDYTSFVHIVNDAGVVVAQQDQPPLNNFAPTRLWASGLPLRDERRISLPLDLPPGVYEVRMGLYSADGGRLPVFRADQPAGDYVVVGRFVVP